MAGRRVRFELRLRVIRVTMQGWEHGFLGVSLVRLLRDQAGYRLFTAKDMLNRLMAGDVVEVEFDLESKAEEFRRLARGLGVKIVAYGGGSSGSRR